MIKNTHLLKQSVIVVTISLASGHAMAAGFQINAQSATGIGRAFAGDAVIADNASVVARNSAAMALFDETSMSLGFETITSLIEVKDASYNGGAIGTVDDVGGTSIAPNFHLIVPIDDKFAVGVTAYSNFGTKTEFPDSYPAGEFAGLTDVKSYNLGLAGSYRINEQWSVGAGLDLIYGQGSMRRAVTGGPTVLDVDKADGWAVGFNLGTTYELNENNRFGLSYRYSPTMDTEDDKGQKISLPLPDIAEFSGYHRIEDTKFAVHYSIQWIGWSAFDKIEFRDLDGGMVGPSYDKDYAWQDGWHFALGGTYYLNDTWTLRAGYMYDTAAQDEVTSISVPDSDRQWFSAGFTYALNEKSDIDFGFTYLLGKDVAVTETTELGTSVNATTHADAILMGLQYNRSF
ncbi:outer membrane protein transport protein [Desulfosediminicola ganghwensis]|uniref:outer membrane protein transport protein n=1 Tax=Desulfosediminicola ganghwensis TaxID=2569540 RepID=UPI0010ABAE89|nr:outer membrane protein transport protein [Desulfosediminicola ganghwensis]